MISIKSPKEIELMATGGKIAAQAMTLALSHVKPGITTLELEKIAETAILAGGASPSFKTVSGYNYTTCININEGIVHGIPGSYKLKVGDIVSIDLGALYKGFHTDMSHTVEVESSVETRFLDTGRNALFDAIKACKSNTLLNKVSLKIQQTIESAGYSVSRELTGHGIGKNLHEDPYITCYYDRTNKIVLREGMCLAVEVIYQKGSPKLATEPDGWTLRTRDRSLSALFEHTIAITSNGPVILTDF